MQIQHRQESLPWGFGEKVDAVTWKTGEPASMARKGPRGREESNVDTIRIKSMMKWAEVEWRQPAARVSTESHRCVQASGGRRPHESSPAQHPHLRSGERTEGAGTTVLVIPERCPENSKSTHQEDTAGPVGLVSVNNQPQTTSC